MTSCAAPAQPERVQQDDGRASHIPIAHQMIGGPKAWYWVNLRKSPIARKIIALNLLAMILLVGGVLNVSSFRDNLTLQRADGLVSEAELIADVFETGMLLSETVNLVTGDGIDVAGTLANMDLRGGIVVNVFSANATLVGSANGRTSTVLAENLRHNSGATAMTNLLSRGWSWLQAVIAPVTLTPADSGLLSPADVAKVMKEGTDLRVLHVASGTNFTVITPIEQSGRAVGVVSISSAAGEIDALVSHEREQVLLLFLISIFVSLLLSLTLASTIANPLADLAAAAEFKGDKTSNQISLTRIRIPDLTSRHDEIGRLSGALSGMVQALYERIDGNEQFAADVSHEIKNPLASLRSAVGSLRVVTKEKHREKLLEVIDHDVRRLDRLVSDISNASRLDSELVKEKEETFDLRHMLGNLNAFLEREAQVKGVDYISDLPNQTMMVRGLEGRLAQVFVNLITNAISFCDEGDTIRLWARRRENRILIAVEDTGPGIPDNALTRIFERFYSERPEGQFGNNSGLGLAISKQIVEAHGGVIWAENIRPSHADKTSEPLGARFVVGLPV